MDLPAVPKNYGYVTHEIKIINCIAQSSIF